MTASEPSLLLLGSGRSHLLLLRAKARLHPNLQLTLVAPDRFALYPDLLPELVAGQLGYRDCHIDLQQLCEQAGARLITSTLESLDLDARHAQLSNGEQVPFDLLSLNGGIQGPEEYVEYREESTHNLSLEPINRFLPGWQGMLERIYRHPKGANLALVGENETSVELALAIRARLASNPLLKRPVVLHLVHPGRSLLPQLPLAAQLQAAQTLQERHIRVHPLFPAVSLEDGQLLSERGQHLPMDEVIWCQSKAPELRAQQLGLAVGEQGFIKVNSHLQSVSHPFVFAVEDLAEFDSPGVASIRTQAAYQAPVLTANLGRYVRGEPLKTYKEPKKSLNFVKFGKDQAMLQRGNTVLSGAWVRRWKKFIDRRYIAGFPRP